jgi:hypothetical protein
MGNDEVLSKLGISKKLAYGLQFQSILLIFATIISLWGVFKLFNQTGITLTYITNFISVFVCISLLIYSFYRFKNKKYQDPFFTISIILYIILIIFGLFSTVLNVRSPMFICTVIILISAIFFLHEYLKNFKSANYAMLVIVIASFIVVILNIMGGMPWFAAVKYIIMPVTIALTYFERAQNGKYEFM